VQNPILKSKASHIVKPDIIQNINKRANKTPNLIIPVNKHKNPPIHKSAKRIKIVRFPGPKIKLITAKETLINRSQQGYCIGIQT
jgi:hypothetical protein